MRAIRYEIVVGNIRRFEPVWIYTTIPVGTARQQPQRSRVLRDDVLSSDPMFVSSLGQQIRQVKEALARLEHLANSRPTPENIMQLTRGLRVVLADYDTSLI
jgi:hypothetical protein